MTITTSSSNRTRHFEWDLVTGLDEEVYPCRCGETNRGDYSMENYWMHNCSHIRECGLVYIGQGMMLCGECGAVLDDEFDLKEAAKWDEH